jgi:hypothetical protein
MNLLVSATWNLNQHTPNGSVGAGGSRTGRKTERPGLNAPALSRLCV